MRRVVHKIKNNKKYVRGVIGVVVILLFLSLYLYLFHHRADSIEEDTVPIPAVDMETVKSPIGYVGLTDGQVNALQQTYDKAEDVNVAKSLLQQYINTLDYKAAYELLQDMKKKDQISQVPGHIPAFISLNYNIQEGKGKGAMTDWEKDSTQRTIYESLYDLAKKDYTSFDQKIQNLPADNSLLVSLNQAKQTYKALKDAPAYYYTGLVAATLMEAGYTSIVEILATDLQKENKDYILPYELLSQIAIKKRDYQKSIEYGKELLKLDPQHLARSSFFLGMAYYYTKDFSNALLYLNQVTDPQYLYDAIRYMILVYYKQGDNKHMMDGFRYLLSEQKLTINDFTLLFDIVFYEPYSKGGSGAVFSVAQEYALSVVIPFIDACRKTVQPVAPYICKYGEAGWYLSQNKTEKALKDLLYVAKKYPHPTVFQALGDYYKSVDDETKAQHYYMRSLMGRADELQSASN